MPTIGFVGLGAMGSRIAQRLLDTYRVYGWNRTAAKSLDLIAHGLIWRDTPKQVAEAADVVFSMVTDDQALTAITDGPDGILAGLGPGKTFVDMSTIAPQTATRVGLQVTEQGAHMLSAPVSGSLASAADSAIVVIAGGPPDAIGAAGPLLKSVSRRIVHVGTQAQALTLKLAINANLAAQILAFGEGLILAERAGIDPALAANVMADSAIGSPAVQGRAPLMLDLPEQPWFEIQAMSKDLRLALDAARQYGITITSGGAVEDALKLAAEHGYSHRDIAALYTALHDIRTPLHL